MSESKYTSFPETGLPVRFKKTFDLAREAHLLVDNDTADFAQFWHFHPVKMAEEAMAARLGDHAVMAALLYEISWPMALQFNVDGKLHQEYIGHLVKASETAQSVKLLDLIQILITRALYICKWASRVLYERQVNHYGLVPASAEML